jgi:hypothetical protein
MSHPRSKATVDAEKLAYWFFRLNGCLTIENFVVHPDQGGGQRTDADILGVRFPYRQELATSLFPMEDHEVFLAASDKPMLFIAEVKLRECHLNGPWTRPDRENLQRVLHALGAFPTLQIQRVAAALYDDQRYEDESLIVRMFALGDQLNEEYQRRRKNVVQLTWADQLLFIHERFRLYRDQKNDHRQWDGTGQLLWDAARGTSPEEFVQDIRARLQDGRGTRLQERG